MNQSSSEAAAQYLVAARRARQSGDRLPESCRPADNDSAFAIQTRVSDLFGEPIGGWKAASPSEGKLAVGPIYAQDIYSTSPCPVYPRGGKASIEPEIAFTLGRDLAPRATPYSEKEVREAILETRLALEILGGRYADIGSVSFPEKLADAMNNQALFVGPVVTEARAQDAENIAISVAGPDGVFFSNDGRNPSGTPFAPLHWLANFLRERGEGLRAGQIVTTGSYCGVLQLPLATPLRIGFGDFGFLSVEFAQAKNSALGAQRGG